MPGIARQFEPQITRSGGVPSKYRFTVRCSTCATTDTHEAGKPVSDAELRRYFDGRGWILGRRRSDDLCSACLETSGNTQPLRSRNEPRRHEFVSPMKQADRTPAPADKRHRETADILTRHLGKPEALAAEVFRPKDLQSSRTADPEASRPPASAPALSPEGEQALVGMAADLKSLRSTMEAIAEQVSRLVAIGGQQIEAIARVAPVMIQAVDGITGGLRNVVSPVHAIPDRPTAAERQLPLEEGLGNAQKQEARSEPERVQGEEASEPAQRVRRRQKSEDSAHRKSPGQVSVKSIPDAKRPDRFYTSIRLPRELWDGAGFATEDRIQIDWTRKTLSVTRVADGGVKPKTIGDAVVVLQSWRLGDINFDRAKITRGDASLRLTVKP
ncbi:hypothetical protein [Microvirga sp. 2TAF3]|uniref:hypothetical protein n=1 Tax=Microvirga sp. 2TAF3 TaxID=3233014 RepID=UPI003F9A8B0B